jgi:hypothetical protein
MALLGETKRTLVAACRRGVESARGGRPDFASVDTEYPRDAGMHRSDIESN